MNKENMVKITKFYGTRRRLAIALSELKKVKVIDSDIIIAYDKLKEGSNAWAMIQGDPENVKLKLPVGQYDVDSGHTITIEPEGQISKIIASQTDQEKFSKKVRDLGAGKEVESNKSIQ